MLKFLLNENYKQQNQSLRRLYINLLFPFFGGQSKII